MSDEELREELAEKIEEILKHEMLTSCIMDLLEEYDISKVVNT